MEPRKQAIIAALRAFIEQRPGFEFANYGSMSAYRQDQRRAQRQLHDARELLRAVELSGSISADDILKACGGGRLQIEMRGNNDMIRGGYKHWAVIGYCTGQYFPVEFRAGVCRLLSSVLWDWTCEKCMPKPREGKDGNKQYLFGADEWMNPGDWLRAHFRQQFGKGMQSRWFD